MGREWELSYRLGMQRHKKNIVLYRTLAHWKQINHFTLAMWSLPIRVFHWGEHVSSPFLLGKKKSELNNLCLGSLPGNKKGDLRQVPLESSELQEKHRRKKGGFALPISKCFLTLLEKRKQVGRDVYLEFMEKMKKKKHYYTPAKGVVPQATNSDFIDSRTGVCRYLEKHRILPGYESGCYSEDNIVLLTFAEHVLAHYLRFLQYGKVADRLAVNKMLGQDTVQTRREMAQYAGSLGGKQQQQNLRDQNRGWYNSEVQRKLGKKGATVAKERGVGAFDPQNLLDALASWQTKFQQEAAFREKMLNNLQQGLKTQAQRRINIYNPTSQRHRVINGKGLSIDGKIVFSPYSIVYEDETFEYSEHRVHMSEDFYWNHIKNRPVGKRANYRNPKPSKKKTFE